VTYRTLQLQFTLDDEQFAALKDELLYSQPHVVDDPGHSLVWLATRKRHSPYCWHHRPQMASRRWPRPTPWWSSMRNTGGKL
jgi:hypothetical protein